MELIIVLVAVAAAIALLVWSLRILREYERAVVFRLGRLRPVKGPGPRRPDPDPRPDGPCGPARGDVDDPAPGAHHARQRAGPGRRGLLLPRGRSRGGDHAGGGLPPATSQIAQTTLRSVLGGADLDQLLAERDQLNSDLQRIIDEQTEPWGIKVTTVEIKDVEIPEAMQRAMARQAEAERERRARSSTPRASSRRPRSSRRRLRSSAARRRRSSSATSRHCSRSAQTRTRRSCSRCRSTCSSRSWSERRGRDV